MQKPVNIFLFASLLFIWNTTLAQTSDSLYFDYNYKICPKAKAVYKSHTNLIDSLDGENTFYFLTGEKESFCKKRNNKIVGIKTSWYKTGVLRATENYSKGKREGETRINGEDGKLKYIETFQDDSLKLGVALGENQIDTIRKYYILEVRPNFKGGNEAFAKYIQKNLVYPKKAIRSNTQGRVVVYFEVDSIGKVHNARVHKGVSPELDEAAVVLLQNSPDWKPGIQKGEYANFKLTIPIVFKLPD